MKTNVRESSIESHYINQALLINQSKGEIIAEHVKRTGWCTRRQIAQATGIETATVSGTVNGLIEDGTLVECPEEDKRPCPITGRKVLWVTHKDRLAGKQLDIFGGVQ